MVWMTIVTHHDKSDLNEPCPILHDLFTWFLNEINMHRKTLKTH